MTRTLEEVQANLPALLNSLRTGDVLTILDHGQPVAEVKTPPKPGWPCTAGSARGKIWMSPDFDAPLEEFEGASE